MAELGQDYPDFAFCDNAGYPAPVHQKALAALGPTPYHRLSWAYLDNLPEWRHLRKYRQVPDPLDSEDEQLTLLLRYHCPKKLVSVDDVPESDIVSLVAAGKDDDKGLAGFGRYAGPATLILSSLADGVKHGYALTKDIEAFAGIRLAPGTLYEALARLDAQGLIEAVESDDRRRPYRLTAAGAAVLRAQLQAQRATADVGLRRLDVHWRLQ
jgi:DNA-binding PadR family transcriptional regulator